jgi:hypothetical protein
MTRKGEYGERERNGMLERDKKQREGLRAFLGRKSILERTGSIAKKMAMARGKSMARVKAW